MLGDRSETALAQVHAEINLCRVCHELFPKLKKPDSMDRGGPSGIAVIGEAPGNTEVGTKQSFSGAAGKRLMEWLDLCGIASPRSEVYFTSAVKCHSSNKSHLKQMADTCQFFLQRQLSTISPAVVISVGELAYHHIRADDVGYPERLNTVYQTSEVSLLTKFNYHYWHVVWPHPSPLNRQLNDPLVKVDLAACCEKVKALLNHLKTRTKEH